MTAQVGELLPDWLTARHGGTRAVWSVRLRAAGLPPDRAESQLTPPQRAELKRLLMRYAPHVGAKRADAPPPNLRDWARAALRRYLETWQPWALVTPDDADSIRIQCRHRWLQHGPDLPAGPPPPLPLADPVLAERLRHPAARTCRPHELRVLALLHAAACHPEVAEVLNRLAPSTRGRGWPVHLLARVACPEHAAAVTLPGDLARTENVRGLEVLRLHVGTKVTLQSAPPAGDAAVQGLLTRLPDLPDDLIPLQLAAHTLASLRDLRMRWQLRARIGVTGGVVALLIGPYGHGKRTTARQLASDLGAELYRVQPGLLNSRWIGETEQRITRMFADMQATGGALVIEDAHDLLTRRVEVHGANDRYSNVTANHLLQEIERFQGLLLLLAPSAIGLDAAMRRRVQVIVRFDEPDRSRRAAILRATWQWLLPRLASPPPAQEPDWLQLAAPALRPSELVHAVCDAGLAVALRGVALDHEAIAQAMQLRAESRNEAVAGQLAAD